jgi:hypothetical protein
MATERERWLALTPAQRQAERKAAKAASDAKPSWLERTFHAGRAKPGGVYDRTRYPNSAGNQRRAAEARAAAAKPTPKPAPTVPATARTSTAAAAKPTPKPAPTVPATARTSTAAAPRAATTVAATSPPVAKLKAKAVAAAAPRNDPLAALRKLRSTGLTEDNAVMKRLQQRAMQTAVNSKRGKKGSTS